MRKPISILSLALVVSGAHAATLTQWNFNQYTDAGSQTSLTAPAPSTGSGSSSLVGTTDGKSVLTDSSSNASSDPNQSGTTSAFWSVGAFAAQGQASGTIGVEFAVSTVGYDQISLSFDQRWTKKASEYGQLQYTIDGTTWLNADTSHGVTGTYANGLIDGSYLNPVNGSFASAKEGFTDGITYDFTGAAGVSNNSKFAVREVAVFAPGTSTYYAASTGSTSSYGGATDGRWKFDEVTFKAQPVPEPTTLAVLGLGVAALRRKRRK